jgi:hypothetical protein
VAQRMGRVIALLFHDRGTFGVVDDHKYVWKVCDFHKYGRSKCHTSLTGVNDFCHYLHVELLDWLKFVMTVNNVDNQLDATITVY